MKKKSIALFLAFALVAGVAIGGTLAWLTANSDQVVNTFTTSDIGISLAETTTDFKMVPGHTISKDPEVTVKANSEKCYLFVKLEESSNFNTFLEYTVAGGWTKLTDVTGVYYREVEASSSDQIFEVLASNQVTVKEDVTKADMEKLIKGEDTYPKLTVTAYASQYMKNNTTPFKAAQAWANVSPSATTD